ncbi:MAG: hypothetical protein KDI33_13540 [Halioglobus sp.]|nr:hypothetical protein [Halioglobus sp.]
MNKKWLSPTVFVSLMLAAASVQALPILLDFEGVGHAAVIDGFYGGGMDSQGNSGPDYGIYFNSDTIAVIDAEAGGTGNFANEPSPDTTMTFDSGSAVMNVIGGFDVEIAFYFSAFRDGLVSVYGGLDGTGDLLAAEALAPQAFDDCLGDPDGDFCNWTLHGVSFSGVARSVVFSGEPGTVGFDNITLGRSTSVQPVPAPQTLALFVIALSGLRFRGQFTSMPGL